MIESVYRLFSTRPPGARTGVLMRSPDEEFKRNAEPTAAWARRWNIVPGDLRDPSDPSPTYSGDVGFVRRGWIPILDRLAEDLVALDWDRTLNQVKQKLGCLRFYVGHRGLTPLSTDTFAAIARRIKEATAESLKTCEECGAPGQLCDPGGRGWIETLCPRCFEAEDAKVKALWAEQQLEDAEADTAEWADNEELAKRDPTYREYLELYVYPSRRNGLDPVRRTV